MLALLSTILMGSCVRTLGRRGSSWSSRRLAVHRSPPEPSQAPARLISLSELSQAMESAPDFNQASPDSNRKYANKAAWGAMVAGAALSVYGWTRKSASGAAIGLAGGAIALKAASAGPIADLVGSETSLSHSVIMMAKREEIFSFWQRSDKVSLCLGAIRELSGAKLGEIDADNPTLGRQNPEFQMLESVPQQHICWRITDRGHSSRDCVAELKLTDLAAARGTLVTLTLRFKLHTGILHSSSPQIIGVDPQRHVRESLRKLKMLMEAGEIATVQGQSHGPRTLKGKLIEAFLREQAA
jgi:uncharacterized membrane protein